MNLIWFKKSTAIELTKLSMRMDWGLGLSTTNSLKDTMLEIWCSSAKIVKGKKKKTKKNELCYDMILYPQRYVGNLELVPSTVMQKKKNSLTKKIIWITLWLDPWLFAWKKKG
jgi:hypothetical protein